MNERQEKLLNYLLKHDGYVSKEDICEALWELYPRYAEKSSDHTSGVFTRLSKDVRDLNNDFECKYIILSNQSGYKLAREQWQAKSYIGKSFARATRIYKRSRAMAEKVGLNMQVQMHDDGSLEVIEVFPDADH